MTALRELPSLPEVADVRSPRLRAVPAGTGGRGLVRSPEVAELRAFCAAVDLGSIGGAARALQISQPGLSKRLRSLEAVIGTPVLHRSTRGVTPTPAGARLYESASRLLAEADAVEAMVCDFRDRAAPARIAATATVAELWLPRALVALEASGQRHLSVQVTSTNGAHVRRMISEGSGDVGLAAIEPGRPPERGLRETVVWKNEAVVGVPVTHPWSAIDEIDPEAFARTAIIRRDPGDSSSRTVDGALASIGLSQVAPIAEIGSTGASIALALAKCAPVLLPAGATAEDDENLVIRRVRGLRFERQFAVLLGGGLHDLPPAARALAQHLLSWRDSAR